MQPPKQERHIAPEFGVGCPRRCAKNTIAIAFRAEQDLLNKEGCGFPDDLTWTADRRARLARDLFISRGDAKQGQNSFREGF